MRGRERIGMVLPDRSVVRQYGGIKAEGESRCRLARVRNSCAD